MSDSDDTDTFSDSEGYSTPSSLNSLMRVATSSLGVNVIRLSYHQTRRLVDIDDEDVTPSEDADDDLSEALISAAEDLVYTERRGSTEVSVEPLQSIALLFDTGEAKSVKARLFLAVDARHSLDISAMLIACDFTRVDGLGTTRFTNAYCRSNSIPNLDSSTLFIDVVASAANPRGAGTLLVLACYLLATRSQKYRRVATIAVTDKGRAAFRALGWEEHSYRESGARTLFWIDTGELKAADVQARLRLDDSVKSRCFRKGASQRTSNKRFARCS
jgi:hypothetical protein